MELPERLAEERKRLRLTQAALGALGGVTKKTQLGYEKGLSSPTADYLQRISSAGVDVAFVLTGRPSQAVEAPIGNPSDDTAFEEVARQPQGGRGFDVSQRLREERIRCGCGQEEFGVWLGGVSAKTVGNWERNVGAPDARQLAQASEHGVDVTYVLSGRHLPAAEAPAASYKVNPKATSAAPTKDFMEQALHAAVLTTITGSRKHGHKLTSDQFIRMVIAMFFEYLQELESGVADIGMGDGTQQPGQTGTHG